MKLTWQHIVLVAILLTAAVVSRTVPNPEDRTLVLIVTAVLAAFLGPAAVNSKQNDRLENIETATRQVQQQTNGVLDRRIREAVRNVLDDRDRTLGKPLRHDPEDNGNRKGTSDVAH